jgi:hypothetical protein
MMKVYRVAYFAAYLQHVAFVTAKNEGEAEKLVREGFGIDENFELYSVQECDIYSENIIHTEVIEFA